MIVNSSLSAFEAAGTAEYKLRISSARIKAEAALKEPINAATEQVKPITNTTPLYTMTLTYHLRIDGN
ncbi:MAG: hypothetical protein DHS20C08_18390 [Rhodomicrobium sp.]|nr:MAG: hypothetical protein DHS20C08_18390 [Rhodomicrobium sp.]